MKIKVVWFKNTKDKDKVKDDLVRALDGFDRLKEILRDKIPDRVTEPDYDNPSWSHRQADMNGYERALKEVIDLIEIDKE